jgi:predicted DsbA family dithiol-disulfide isomerase
MKVEIWSDIMCPFCFIGKRNYETALAQFRDAKAVDTEWKSFQLDPDLPGDGTQGNVFEYLSSRKGLTVSQAREMTAGVADAGTRAGVELNFERTMVVNTFDGHRLLHLAKKYNLGNTVKELLFQAHFTEGRDISDPAVLHEIGSRAGLDAGEVVRALQDSDFAAAVRKDILEAQQIGVRGVPFFVFNRKYAISGAQPVDMFAETLEKAFNEWKEDHPMLTISGGEGAACADDGCSY